MATVAEAAATAAEVLITAATVSREFDAVARRFPRSLDRLKRLLVFSCSLTSAGGGCESSFLQKIFLSLSFLSSTSTSSSTRALFLFPSLSTLMISHFTLSHHLTLPPPLPTSTNLQPFLLLQTRICL